MCVHARVCGSEGEGLSRDFAEVIGFTSVRRLVSVAATHLGVGGGEVG